MSAEGGDAATSLLEIIEERKKAWALAKAVGERKPQGIECSSAVYGQINADETVYVIPEEAPNCRSLCRALLHKSVYIAGNHRASSPTSWLPLHAEYLGCFTVTACG